MFSYVWHSYFLRYGHFVEYACNELMPRTVGVGGGLDFTTMASKLLGVSLRARRDTTQVMSGCQRGSGETQL